MKQSKADRFSREQNKEEQDPVFDRPISELPKKILTKEEACKLTLKILNTKVDHLIKMLDYSGGLSYEVTLAKENVKMFVKKYNIEKF